MASPFHFQIGISLGHMAGNVSLFGAIGDDLPDALRHPPEIIVILHHEHDPVVFPEVVVQLALALANAFHPAEALQMCLAAIGDDTMIRFHILAVSFDLFLMIGAHFDHGHFCI